MRFSRLARVLLTSSLFATSLLHGQSARMRVDGKTSLAWWQVDPHYEHLWATTCPADPSWQPGEGRDPGLYTDYNTRPQTTAADRSDSRIPLFPRFRVRPICRQAVSGDVTIADIERLSGVRGTVTLVADSLFTGLGMRDAYQRRAVLETTRYPTIVFTIDSLTEVQRGDTIRAVAVGQFTVHGVATPMRAPLTATRDAAGLRVRTQFSIPAAALTDVYHMSKVALGMGVVMRRWRSLHLGVDLILISADS
jgi:hypothetical protein